MVRVCPFAGPAEIGTIPGGARKESGAGIGWIPEVPGARGRSDSIGAERAGDDGQYANSGPVPRPEDFPSMPTKTARPKWKGIPQSKPELAVALPPISAET